MVLLDAPWWQPELTHQNVSPVHTEHEQGCQLARSPPHSVAAKEIVGKEEQEGQQQHPVPVQQLSAIVLIHLVIDVMQFLHWCINMLAARRMPWGLN